MNSNNWEKDLSDAKNNCNYFLGKLIYSIFGIIFKLSLIILISIIFNYLIINIIALLYTIYALYQILAVINYYSKIINDISETIGEPIKSFTIDLNIQPKKLIKKIINLGKY